MKHSLNNRIGFMDGEVSKEGRIAELWVEWDNVAMLTQLGLSPPPVPPSTEE